MAPARTVQFQVKTVVCTKLLPSVIIVASSYHISLLYYCFHKLLPPTSIAYYCTDCMCIIYYLSFAKS